MYVVNNRADTNNYFIIDSSVDYAQIIKLFGRLNVRKMVKNVKAQENVLKSLILSTTQR